MTIRPSLKLSVIIPCYPVVSPLVPLLAHPSGYGEDYRVRKETGKVACLVTQCRSRHPVQNYDNLSFSQTLRYHPLLSRR